VNLALTEEQEFVGQSFSALFAKEASPESIRAAEPFSHDSARWNRIVETGALGVGVGDDRGGRPTCGACPLCRAASRFAAQSPKSRELDQAMWCTHQKEA
jgi:hypothetical protein